MKVPQLLQHFEHLVSPLAVAMSTWTQEYGVKSIVSEVVRLAPTYSGTTLWQANFRNATNNRNTIF